MASSCSTSARINCLSKELWQSSESIHATADSVSSSSGIQSPSSPDSLSPSSTSPESTLMRHHHHRPKRHCTPIEAHSVREPFTIRSDCRDSRSQSPETVQQAADKTTSIVAYVIGWYPYFLLRLLKYAVFSIVPMTTWWQLMFALPMLVCSVWLWCVVQLVSFPFTATRTVVSTVLSAFGAITTTAAAATMPRHKRRTVLISGGSTIQALHLARNFYSAGARVIVCEIEGVFSVARFSIAVSKFYAVPRPTTDHQQHYIRTLCSIVEREQASYYIPVSSTTAAYYDALAKPHLELLGCTCFCPGIKEVWALDDTLEIMKHCRRNGIPTPAYHLLTSVADVHSLYDSEGGLRTKGGIVMNTTGASGLRDRVTYVLPTNRDDVNVPSEISEHRPWVAIHSGNDGGEQFVTCTTVKESHVVANVTCRVDGVHHSLVPVVNAEIDQWLDAFFGKLQSLRPITGHVSFRFVVARSAANSAAATLVPLSSRVGVALPYICYTSVHPRILCRPCKHFRMQNFGPLVDATSCYWLSKTMLHTIRNPNLQTLTHLIATVLNKREVLFVLWDPIPYCAYYHMLLPFKNILRYVQTSSGTQTDQQQASASTAATTLFTD